MDTTTPVGTAQDANTNGSNLTDEEKARLQVELSQVEEEIRLLQETLAVKVRRCNEIKKSLGYTSLSTLQHDLMENIHKLEDTEAYIKTTELISKAKDKTVTVAQDAKEKVESTISAIRNSEVVKSINDRVGTAYSTVKDVIIHSTYGHAPDDDSANDNNNNNESNKQS
uniref:Tumor protein D52 n=1 Tax=Trichobilharzia regenti TaxID=157069 RepID=A0AA85JNM8_TRIRE|nr:unnamed protein product [Trichobilharzia regenti]